VVPRPTEELGIANPEIIDAIQETDDFHETVRHAADSQL
jgi:hypothetical protein